jgi:hypothetical protein
VAAGNYAKFAGQSPKKEIAWPLIASFSVESFRGAQLIPARETPIKNEVIAKKLPQYSDSFAPKFFS